MEAIITADLGFGDAGKGSLVDYLTRLHGAHTVVRYNGGAQAAHNVITPDGRHHTFAQFGSGSFIPDVRTHLSRYMLVDPPAMLAEARHLIEVGAGDPFLRTTLNRRALIISPYQQIANRVREIARGAERHGSCGLGIGETMRDWLTHGEQVLLAGDLTDPGAVRRKLRFLRDAKRADLMHVDLPAAAERYLAPFDDPGFIEACAEVYAHFAERVTLVDDSYLPELYQQGGTILFEGAQGVLLDEWHGFHPYTTWSTTTFANANALVEGFPGQVTRLGVMRAYLTRHGVGPFVTEDATLTPSLPELHNTTNRWQQGFRVGWLDLVAMCYALAVTGPPDYLAVTHLDRLAAHAEWQVCNVYMHPAEEGLERFFAVKDGQITGIRVCRPPDLAHQTELTRLLGACAPCYEPVPADTYLPMIEEALGVMAGLISYGPTANEKRPSAAWERRFKL